jgi:hypothetical protein
MKGEIVTKAKRLIGRMNVEELREIEGYTRQRWAVVRGREEGVKLQARWEKIASLPVGSEVAVNAHGYREFPRGTVLTVEAYLSKNRRRKTLQLQPAKPWRLRYKACG